MSGSARGFRAAISGVGRVNFTTAFAVVRSESFRRCRAGALTEMGHAI